MVISIRNLPIHAFIAASSVSRDAAQDLSQRATKFGVRVARSWSEFTTHYIIDRFPDVSGALSLEPRTKQRRKGLNIDTSFKEKPSLQWVCGLLAESQTHFIKVSWLEAFVRKGELPRGSRNYEEKYDPPNEQDYLPDGPNPELWVWKEKRVKMFKQMTFFVVYHGITVDKTFETLIKIGGGNVHSYSISSDKAIPSAEKWAQIIQKTTKRKSGGNDSGSPLVVLVGLQKEVLETYEDWRYLYLEGAKMMDMQFVSRTGGRPSTHAICILLHAPRGRFGSPKAAHPLQCWTRFPHSSRAVPSGPLPCIFERGQNHRSPWTICHSRSLWRYSVATFAA
ncbi:uncharacterized protein EI90DRAFT_1902602 [Cantharellus anzutake]|uniref:uncharacterized protein n=1 Tax=Cantharellus anzutake TaxID=1750568 RepID=UPI0019062E3F|nr:uncharacterized protein EI90DRAFT_1902602 [Cantharellus anzutake]KAF8326539.1 hypothetical protein EI90DRAFT_1902602 [Cantharellus anzutake]